MELEQLLALLGVSNFAEAVTAVTRMNAFLTDARAQTGRNSAPETLEAVRAQCNFARSVEASVGAQGGDAIARIAALQASADRLKEVEGQMQAMLRAQGDAEATQLMDEAVRAGRLEPSKRDKAQAIYSEYGVKALRTFIEMLPAATVQAPGPQNSGGAPRQPHQPAPESDQSLEHLTAEELQVAKAMGKTPEMIIEAKKLWASTNGRLPDAQLVAMNEAQLRASRTNGLGTR